MGLRFIGSDGFPGRCMRHPKLRFPFTSEDTFFVFIPKKERGPQGGVGWYRKKIKR